MSTGLKYGDTCEAGQRAGRGAQGWAEQMRNPDSLADQGDCRCQAQRQGWREGERRGRDKVGGINLRPGGLWRKMGRQG